jgi:uncharacterized protein (DUF1697 family)
MHVALLRAINLAGRNRVAMADLRVLVEALGMKNVATLLQSGNVVFSAGATKSGDALERALETAAAKEFGFAIDFFVRTDKEWRAVVAGNPFRREAISDPGRLVVVFLKDAPKAAGGKALQDAIPGREVVRFDPARGRHAYIYYPDGQGRSKLTSALLEKKLGTRGTARNWNTVLKLAEVADA